MKLSRSQSALRGSIAVADRSLSLFILIQRAAAYGRTGRRGGEVIVHGLILCGSCWLCEEAAGDIDEKT